MTDYDAVLAEAIAVTLKKARDTYLPVWMEGSKVATLQQPRNLTKYGRDLARRNFGIVATSGMYSLHPRSEAELEEDGHDTINLRAPHVINTTPEHHAIIHRAYVNEYKKQLVAAGKMYKALDYDSLPEHQLRAKVAARELANWHRRGVTQFGNRTIHRPHSEAALDRIAKNNAEEHGGLTPDHPHYGAYVKAFKQHYRASLRGEYKGQNIKAASYTEGVRRRALNEHINGGNSEPVEAKAEDHAARHYPRKVRAEVVAGFVEGYNHPTAHKHYPLMDNPYIDE